MIPLPCWPISDERELELLKEVLRSPQWGGFSPLVAQFEEAFAAYHGCRYGVSAVNGTATLEMMLVAAGLRPGDEVIVPAISFVSTATAVSRVGAVPVFVDIEPYSFNMDSAGVRAAVSAKTRAVVCVHFGGALCEIDALAALCREHGLTLLEDAAHAHGSEWNGQRAGSFGLASSFSFQNGKVMTAGEGGIVLTSDEAYAARLRSFANQGRRAGHGFFHHFELGNNYRLTGLQAAVLLAQLERLDAQIALRQRNWEVFREACGDSMGIVWQQVPRAVNRNSWYLLLGRVNTAQRGETRNDFCERLTAHGVPCTPFYPHALYGNPLYTSGTAPCRITPCPNAEACIQDAFWIGFRALMSDAGTTRQVARLAVGLHDAVRL